LEEEKSVATRRSFDDEIRGEVATFDGKFTGESEVCLLEMDEF
jgi:hypothetical protein